METPLSIIVIGASGDLARKKIFPALFSLYCRDLLPADTRFFGLARSRFTDDAFRSKLTETLTCRYTPEHSCAEKMEAFLQQCFYQSGAYDAPDSFLELHNLIRARGEADQANRLFYFAVPPFVFLPAAQALGDAGLIDCNETHRLPQGWTRLVLEKPFGRDRASSDSLQEQLTRIVTEPQIYRIDHYLGKEMIQNLLALRFANRVFEPLWNREHVESVQIVFHENIGVAERSGYFDQYGIVRDVMQNHLLQMLALTAMERPAAWSAAAIRAEKVRLLQAVPPLRPEELKLGQYASAQYDGIVLPGYLEEAGVASDSRAATFASCVLRVENERWKGVPFYLEAGKAMQERLTEIRVRFRPADAGCCPGSVPPGNNELVVRVQPDEALLLRIFNKVPGLHLQVAETELNLLYKTAFKETLPEAYESLLLDALAGDKTFFLGADEVAAAWDVFTPALHAADSGEIPLATYPHGSAGPTK